MVRTALPWVFGILIATVILGLPGLHYRYTYEQSKRLRVVTDGKFYRSGQLPASGFRDASRRHGIKTVIWATGYRPDYSWLDLPVFDHRGRIRHRGGVVADAPGVYLIGGNLLRTRRSSYICGSDADSAAIASHLHRHLANRAITKVCGVAGPAPASPQGSRGSR